MWQPETLWENNHFPGNNRRTQHFLICSNKFWAKSWPRFGRALGSLLEPVQLVPRTGVFLDQRSLTARNGMSARNQRPTRTSQSTFVNKNGSVLQRTDFSPSLFQMTTLHTQNVWGHAWLKCHTFGAWCYPYILECMTFWSCIHACLTKCHAIVRACLSRVWVSC